MRGLQSGAHAEPDAQHSSGVVRAGHGVSERPSNASFGLSAVRKITSQVLENSAITQTHLEIARSARFFSGLLKAQVRSDFFSPSLKRAAGVVLRAIYALGIPNEDEPAPEVGEDPAPIQAFQLGWLVQRAKDLETVLANELPGLATYSVSPKGIFSTDDLITNAELQIPEAYRSVLNDKAKADIQQAGKCLAFELPTASAFHMWRSVESVMDSYHEALTRKSFLDAGVTRNWGAYIKALETARAEKKITVFLDHIREEYRNPISHPNEMLELDEAFALFGPAISAIGQMLKEICEIRKRWAIEVLAVSPPKSATAP